MSYSIGLSYTEGIGKINWFFSTEKLIHFFLSVETPRNSALSKYFQNKSSCKFGEKKTGYILQIVIKTFRVNFNQIKKMILDLHQSHNVFPPNLYLRTNGVVFCKPLSICNSKKNQSSGVVKILLILQWALTRPGQIQVHLCCIFCILVRAKCVRCPWLLA